MARTLQLRRGNAAQNNKFTGMPGEISFDTDAKTIRVHDGIKIGGFILARADSVSNNTGTGGTSPAFDINSVSPEFWATIVKQYAPAGFATKTSSAVPVSSTTIIEYIFAVTASVRHASAELICITDDAGYVAGDVVSAFGIGARTNPNPYIFNDTSGAHVRMMIGGENFWVSNKTTGITTNILKTSWKIQFTIWY